MLDFKKEHKYLLCIDSDGTIMDTMTIKHKNCFGPCFIKTFNIKENVDDILSTWNYINLYSKTRGINRFIALLKIIDYTKEKFNYLYDGYEEFYNFVTTSHKLSNDELKKYIAASSGNKTCLELALIWSNMVNESINNLSPSQTFKNVKEILEKLSKDFDLVGVSSANREAVKEEWTRLGFINIFKFVGCQDIGTKKEIISEALENGYEKENTFMLGDALLDYEAAKENGVYFFPIIPKQENESWERLNKDGEQIILEGKFNKEYQESLLKEFLEVLK